MFRVACIIVIGFAIVTAIAILSGDSTDIGNPEQLARRVDALLDQEKPLKCTEDELVNKWPQEVAPYFAYELLTNGEAKTPKVDFFTSSDAFMRFHTMGYTFMMDPEGNVYLNEFFRNPVSPHYQDVSALTTLVHETAHIQGGDFTGLDSEASEKNAQLATLEVLAAMANHGNPYARQALLSELRDICTGVVLSRCIDDGDLKRYHRFSHALWGHEKEKGMRRWNLVGLAKLEEILKKYSVSVFNDFQDFKFSCKAEGDKAPRTFIMDDLEAFLNNL